ncbi:prenyltransferase/squalene oxidase repeat-containing protein [Mangrovibacterium marinum]|uniref:Squalene-hopene/tetraprenyl-beta-curcumene cyclase n=1 Tax=Mangrovibacterium marinum TaxID=1639118 RepID=A0A2T5C0W5_9BACT|nr:prenyltransferase/squalene oxidase repeat-containing protein [Mangrovibacterium marinum]PTN08231.1 squalene-hopene/tetraprenyl-beta-curcumene cyclase [Mangrovibacterium marinum]
MINDKQIDELIEVLQNKLAANRISGDGSWRSTLSSSAISTSVSAFALYLADSKKHKALIEKGQQWLFNTMLPDGSWGDSPESPTNMTATLLSYAALFASGSPSAKTKVYLEQTLGGSTDQQIIDGVLRYYGKDLTFSAPILVMCALAGLIQSWENIPQLPFELSVLPQRVFRFLQLPVVSYAIPALIAVGILRHKKGRRNLLSPVRDQFINRSLTKLQQLQPENGGFLEAAPLTAFVAICLCGAGYSQLASTQKAISFLVETVRKDGSWPIDTNLDSWATVLSIRALGNDIQNKQALADQIKQRAFTYKHPFTGAHPGGWAWTNLPGAVPDADDTAGTLVALHTLLNGEPCAEIENGINWLLGLQNSDGGIPTFCKGWGKLPFDASSPDITAHTLQAIHLWIDVLPSDLRAKCRKRMKRMLKWMQKTQTNDGAWVPLWFGDQNASDEKNPVYGTAVAVEYLAGNDDPVAKKIVSKGIDYLRSTQNKDGGWGGAPQVPSKVTTTARALSALAVHGCYKHENTETGYGFLYKKYKQAELFQPEPIGLYFSRLWYSEEMYNITFALNALQKIKNQKK